MGRDILSAKVGVEFEDAFCECVRARVAGFRRATEDEDLYRGTDCFINGIPVDFTSAMSTKDNMVLLEETIDIDGYKFQFGVRTGNCHVTFEEPVLVLGVDYEASFIKKFGDEIISALKWHLTSILETGQDLYLDYCYPEPA